MSAPPHDWAEHNHVPVLDDQRPFFRRHVRFPIYLFQRHRTAASDAWFTLQTLKGSAPGRGATITRPKRAPAQRAGLIHRVPRRWWGHGALLGLVCAIVLTNGLAELALKLDWAQGALLATDYVAIVDPAVGQTGVAAPIVLPEAASETARQNTARDQNDSRAPSWTPQQGAVPSAYIGSYTVQAGEQLGQIAARYGISVLSLVAANDIDPKMLAIGQQLRIPRMSGLPHTVVEGDTVERIAELYNVPSSAIRFFPANNLSAGRSLVAGEELFVPNALPIGNGPSETEVAAATAIPIGTVLDDETRIRLGPSTEYEKLAKLPANTQVALVGRYENWFKIRTANGTEGWIASDLLGVGGGFTDQIAVVTEIPALPTPEPAVVAEQPAAAPAPKPQAGARWVWPTTGDLTSAYGYRNMSVGRFHNGYDIANSKWTPIRAAGAGRVIEAGWCSGYGYCVKIDHGGGLISEYGHMAAQPNVRTGDRVAAGDRIGSMGMTYDRKGGGYATGVHLHFTLKLKGNAVNPARYLP